MADRNAVMARGGTRVRVWVAQAVWLLACVALDANRDNALVKFVLDVADAVDLEAFSRDNGIFKFSGGDAATKNALANWGLGAVAYLVGGRVLERIIRP